MNVEEGQRELAQLTDFLGKLKSYDSYVHATTLTDDQTRNGQTLREELVRKCGELKELIVGLTRRQYYTQLWQTHDMWVTALAREAYPPDMRTALGKCIDATNEAIGKLTISIDADEEKGKPSGTEVLSQTSVPQRPKAFISHGKESIALPKIERFLRELGIEPLIVKEQASLDKTVDGKVNHYLEQADCVLILATGDDEIDGKLHPRQNVIHEVGLAQKTHGGRIVYLLEKGAEFPSNIGPKVWESFDQRNLENVFLRIVIELKAVGILRATK